MLGKQREKRNISKLLSFVPFFLLERPWNATRAMEKYKGSNNKCEDKKEAEQ